MVDIGSLIKAIVTPLVTKPEAVAVTAHETDEYMAFDLAVAPEDVGRVIGKQASCPGNSNHCIQCKKPV